MSLYSSFIGIDIGKKRFVVGYHGTKTTQAYDNTPEGIHEFLSSLDKIASDSLCILEATGGYEMQLLLTLCSDNISVHRANTRKVKHFIRSFGNDAKTDALDAKALAKYGYERHAYLELFAPSTEKALELYELVQRRNDLKQILVAEKNRLKSPRAHLIQGSIEAVIKLLKEQLVAVNEGIDELINKDEVLSKKRLVLKTIPGIGDIVASEILALMPELGEMNRRQVASLAGLAPRAQDSGQFSGYRRAAAGRNHLKPMLFLAAMSARNSHSELRDFYERLVKKGKKKMVALAALMRKIIVIANARLKELDAKS